MHTVPSSSMSIFVPVSAIMELMTLPCLPTTSPIFSGSMEKEMIRGAYLESSGATSGTHSSILPKMNCLPSLACSIAVCMISSEMPLILISIWMAVIPFIVPATLKSMSPRKSSKP